MTTIQSLARAVLDGSARWNDAKQLAEQVLAEPEVPLDAERLARIEWGRRTDDDRPVIDFDDMDEGQRRGAVADMRAALLALRAAMGSGPAVEAYCAPRRDGSHRARLLAAFDAACSVAEPVGDEAAKLRAEVERLNKVHAFDVAAIAQLRNERDAAQADVERLRDERDSAERERIDVARNVDRLTRELADAREALATTSDTWAKYKADAEAWRALELTPTSVEALESLIEAAPAGHEARAVARRIFAALLSDEAVKAAMVERSRCDFNSTDGVILAAIAAAVQGLDTEPQPATGERFVLPVHERGERTDLYVLRVMGAVEKYVNEMRGVR